jgi:hypothetical protein
MVVVVGVYVIVSKIQRRCGGCFGFVEYLLASQRDEGAVKGGEETAPDGKGPADARRFAAHGLHAAAQSVASRTVLGAHQQMVQAATHRAHPECATHVVQDSVRTGLAPVVYSWTRHTVGAVLYGPRLNCRESRRRRKSLAALGFKVGV